MMSRILGIYETAPMIKRKTDSEDRSIETESEDPESPGLCEESPDAEPQRALLAGTKFGPPASRSVAQVDQPAGAKLEPNLSDLKSISDHASVDDEPRSSLLESCSSCVLQVEEKPSTTAKIFSSPESIKSVFEDLSTMMDPTPQPDQVFSQESFGKRNQSLAAASGNSTLGKVASTEKVDSTNEVVIGGQSVQPLHRKAETSEKEIIMSTAPSLAYTSGESSMLTQK